jgi:hypothetical protein
MLTLGDVPGRKPAILNSCTFAMRQVPDERRAAHFLSLEIEDWISAMKANSLAFRAITFRWENFVKFQSVIIIKNLTIMFDSRYTWQSARTTLHPSAAQASITSDAFCMQTPAHPGKTRRDAEKLWLIALHFLYRPRLLIAAFFSLSHGEECHWQQQ